MKVEVSIGMHGRKSNLATEVLKAAILSCIDNCPKDFVRCYIDGSASGGTGDGGYSFSTEWPDGEKPPRTVSDRLVSQRAVLNAKKPAFEMCA